MEPDNAMAPAWAAYWHLFYVGQGWSRRRRERVRDRARLRAARDPARSRQRRGARRSTRISAPSRIAISNAALHYFDRALRLNPNLAFIWALSAPTYCYIGQPEKALKRLERYRELAPFHPYFFWVENLYAIAYT